MKKQFIFIILLVTCAKSYSQKKASEVNRIGISIPIVWNNSQGVFYALGGRKETTGKGISYGINFNYSKSIYKNLFGIVGTGYFKQDFGIKRPFDYTAPDGTKPLVYTENYSYSTLHLLLGLGYQKLLTKKLLFNGKALFNIYNSKKQEYAQNYLPNSNEITKKSLSIGNMITFDLEIEKKITNKISLGAGVVFPVYTKWNKDLIFFSNGYSNDEQQIAKNKFSIGTAISCYYHF